MLQGSWIRRHHGSFHAWRLSGQHSEAGRELARRAEGHTVESDRDRDLHAHVVAQLSGLSVKHIR